MKCGACRLSKSAFPSACSFGGFLMASWGGFSNRVYSMALANIVTGICTVVLGLPPSFSIYVLLMGAIGIIIPLFNTPATVMLQERVEGAYLGRVFGVNTIIASSLMPLSMLVYGPLADVIAVERLLGITGAVMIVQSALVFVNRPLREAGEPVVRAAPN